MHVLAIIFVQILILDPSPGGGGGGGGAKKIPGGQLPPMPPYFLRLCPCLIRNERLRALRKRTFALLSDRKDRVQRTKQGEILRVSSLWKRAEYQIRIKSFRKINGGQNSLVWRPFLLEAIPNRLGQEKNLIDIRRSKSLEIQEVREIGR